jgi:hypothetical protein
MSAEALGPIGQAQADHAAGHKDLARYEAMTRDGAIYRQAWQQARREAEHRETFGAIIEQANGGEAVAPLPPAAATRETDDVPDFIEQTSREGTKSNTPEPARTVGQAPEPAAPARNAIVQAVTDRVAEQVRLQTGENKPKRPEKKDAAQLDLFG